MKLKIREDLTPTNDYIFQCVFGNKGSEKITKDFLNTILEEKIEEIEINHEVVTDKNILDEKVIRLDVKAKINGEKDVDLEMQMSKNMYMTARILYNWSKLFSSQIVEGEKYNKLHKVICVLIIDYEDELIEKIPKLLTRWKIKEENFTEVMLTDLLEIDIISLRKLNELKCGKGKIELKDLKEKEELIPWLKFIKNPRMLEEDVMEKNKSIKEAKEIYESVMSDAERVKLAELRAEKSSMYDTGLYDGIKRGIEEGKKQTEKEIAKKLKENKIDIDIIINTTGLSKEEIEQL